MKPQSWLFGCKSGTENFGRMRKSHLLTFVFLFHAVLGSAQWTIQDGYSISFNGKGAEGTFSGLTGTIRFDPNDLEQSTFDVSLDPATIATGNNTKNKHARGDSWFDVEKYPTITFRSKRITTLSSGFQVVGELTMHGVSREISFPFSFSQEGNLGIFEGSLKLNREDFGIEGPFISWMVDEEFEVGVIVPVKK